jgi:phosphomannomutase
VFEGWKIDAPAVDRLLRRAVLSDAEDPPFEADTGNDDLIKKVEAWIADDPDQACRAELRVLLDSGARDELAARFRGGLRFGTAGLRGMIGAGPACMNVATVRRASAGLAAYLADSVPGSRGAGVVVGYDARHGSRRFAEETARVLSGAGFRVLRLPGELPTPLLAFAVRHLSCAGGVMITASHNPPQDNGYKVYMGNGAQIVPPVDDAISAAISQVGPLHQVPLGDSGEEVGPGIVADYLDAIIAALPASASHDITTVYTPLHGVGRDVLLAGFAQVGFSPPHVVAEQAAPDPDFPTLAKPNPEEPGALNLAIAQAQKVGADLVLANDPDADRLAVAIPFPGEGNGWRQLRGDELGAVLGGYLLERAGDVEHAIVATTVVSSGLLCCLAEAAGARYAETLTGFKWIMHDSAARSNVDFLFGYEEAIGYAVNSVVRDKDGISAALLVAGIAAEAKQQGRTLADRLDDITRRFGLYATEDFALDLPGSAGEGQSKRVMAGLRASPPAQLAGCPVTEIDDLLSGLRLHADGHRDKLELPASDVLIWRCAEQIRVVVRPSGTEPKLKVYLQVVVPVEAPGDVAAATGIAQAQLAKLNAVIRFLLERP